MGLFDRIKVDRILMAEYHALQAAKARGGLGPLLAWAERHTGLDREALLEHEPEEFGALLDRINAALFEPSMDEQRDVKRLNDGRAETVPLWLLLLEVAGGDPLTAQRYEQELTMVWFERMRVYRRGGPEGRHLSGGPTREGS